MKVPVVWPDEYVYLGYAKYIAGAGDMPFIRAGGAIYISSAIINIALNFLLVPYYGALGAAWATLISFILLAGFLSFYSMRLYSVSTDFPRLLAMGIVATSAYILSLIIDINQKLTIIVKIILLILPSLIILRIGKMNFRILRS